MSEPSLSTIETSSAAAASASFPAVPEAPSVATASLAAAVVADMAEAEAMATAAAASAMAAAVADAMAASSAATALAASDASAGTAPAAKPRTRSTNLTHEQKRLICLYAKQNPTATQAQLGKWAKDQFALACVPSQSSISHTLKKRHAFEHMKSEDWSSKRLRTVKYPELDTALANWFLYCQARQVRIQGDEIKAKAQLFFDLLQLHAATGGAEPPQFSNGWLHSFQSRHGFSRSPNTHPHATDHELITSREELVDATKAFAPWDVYWMDETKLTLGLQPERFAESADDDVAAAAAMAAATDRQMTVAFCCNADGSELLDPFFICDGPLDLPSSGSDSSNAEAAQSVEYGFTYAYNKKIWMTPTLFREWVLAFDWKMHEENRQVLLLLDSFSSHQVKKLTLKNVTVRFVAQTPFGASYLDSVEHTVFAAVKRRYRLLHATSLAARQDDAAPGQAPNYTDVGSVQAIQWALKSWREVPKALVADAFAQVGLATDELVAAGAAAATNDAAVLQAEVKIEEQLAAVLKDKLHVKEPVRLSEFVSPVTEKIVDEDFTDQDFVDCAMDSCLSTSVEGRTAEPPRKIARVSRVKKPFQAGGAFAARSLGGAGASAAAVAAARAGAALRLVSAEDLAAATAAVPDEEWQAWADSQRYRIDEFHALETVIRLAAEMNCEHTTMLDLTRMQAELLQRRQPDARAAAGTTTAGLLTASAASTGGDAASGGGDSKQAASVCRFNFGAGSTTI